MKILQFALLALCALCAASALAQKADQSFQPYTLAFRLSDAEASAIARKPALPFDEAWLHTLADTLFKPEEKYQLPPGAYLLVQAREETLVSEFFLSNSLQINLLNTSRDFSFALVDSLGHDIPDARVLLEGKPVPFDSAQKCYRFYKRTHGGLLEVYAHGELLLAEIMREDEGQRSLFWRVYDEKLEAKKGFIRTVYKPVALAKALHWRVKIKANERKRRRSRDQVFQGYITLSQPVYRPGDTLRVKAYLTTGTKGKPWNKPLEMTFNQHNGKPKIKRTLLPASPGNFEYSWPLNDSLTLDQDVWLSFNDQPKNPIKQRNMNMRFRYEDYELDEVSFEAKATQETYRRGEPVTLSISAFDANGQPMVEGQLDLSLTPTWVNQYFEAELYVPDTLWHTTLSLSSSGKTLLEVPDSIWPEANLRVSAKAQFTNSAGELQEKVFSFEVEREYIPVEARVENDSIFISLKAPKLGRPVAGNLEQANFSLLETWHDRDEDTQRDISLPYGAPLPPGLADLELQANGKRILGQILEHTSSASQPRGAVWWEGDTACFKLSNPVRVAIRWWVARNKVITASGMTVDPHWKWQIVNSEPSDFTLHYTYTWEGQEQNAERTLQSPPQNRLSIQLDQPEQVQPGAQVPVKIKVLDAQDRPVQNVQISAGAYSAQFESLETDAYNPRLPYIAPRIRQHLAKTPHRYKPFEIDDLDQKRFIAPLGSAWQKRLGVESLLYYRLRNVPNEAPLKSGTVRGFAEAFSMDSTAFTYPIAGRLPNLPTQEDSFAFHHPQFTPYLVQGGKSVPIYLIWCNSQLVWYAGTTDARPYSFYGRPGYNSLKLRTRDGEFSLDSLWLEKGERLVFSIEKEDVVLGNSPLKWANFSNTKRFQSLRIRYQLRSPKISAFERNTLQQTMLLWRPEGYGNAYQYFWESAENIHVLDDGQRYYSGQTKPHIIGPFPPGSIITTLRQGKFLSRFKFEPGFEYNIEAGRERLYQSNWPPDTLTFRGNIVSQYPDEAAFGPQDIQPLSTERPRILFSYAGASKPGAGKFHLGQLPKDLPLLAFSLAGDSLLGPFDPAIRTVSGIRPGAYRLLLLSGNGQLAEHPILIRANTIFHLDVPDVLFRKPLPGERLDSLFRLDWSEANMRTFFTQAVPFTLGAHLKGSWTLQGTVTESNGETLIGATVKVMQNGVLIANTITDIEGYYTISVLPGSYEVEVSYTGFESQRVVGVQVMATQNANKLNFVLEGGWTLQEVVISGLGITRGKRVLGYATVGLTSIDGGDVNIKGARANGTNYYIDGIRVTTGSIPVQDLDQFKSITSGIISVNDEEPFAEATEARNQFSDYAYWQPNLRTDAKGEAYFQATFPDNITAWRSYVLGMDRHARAGMTLQTTQAFKALQAQLSLPRFVVAGDRFEAVGRVRNLLPDSTEVRTQFIFEGKTLKEKTTQIGPSLVESQSLEVPQHTDSLTIAYNMQGRQSADGEARSIAILPLGTLERNGQFLLLEGDTSCSLQFDPAHGPVSISLRQSALPLLLDDVQYLKDYPYGCNEQTASRLLALLVERDIQTALQQPLPHEKPLRECLKRLEQSQLPDGSWGWWAGGRTNAWMTAYVTKALWKAGKSGFPAVVSLEKGLAWLRQNLTALPLAEQRTVLFALRECGVNVDCKPYLIATGNVQYQSLNTLRLRQLCGEKILRDSLLQWLQASATGGLRAAGSEYGWYDGHAQNTLLAYDLAIDAGFTDIADGIHRYWLESRSAATHRNTLETAQILLRLLPTALDPSGKLAESRLEINGVAIDNLDEKQHIAASQQPMRIRKTGAAPLYFAAWQEWQNPNPWAVDSLFKVETRLEQGGQTVRALRKGEPAELVLTLDARKSAEYLMLEIPIPAGCSYGLKTQQGGFESHREYFRERTAIFCEALPAGRHMFRIALETRFEGDFTLNPARVELMYFPVLFGRNAGKLVNVKE